MLIKHFSRISRHCFMASSRTIFLYSKVAVLCGFVGGFTSAVQADETPNALDADVKNLPETVQIIGKKHSTSAPVGRSEFIDASEFSPSVSNLSQLVADTPGAELSGQGGLFQVYSLRGMSRWRVLTQFAGVPIHTERRAGTAASFISPWLMQGVEVIKGPVSTLYGSGGMAGITQITPRQYSGINIETGISSDDQTKQQNIGWGDEQYSLGLSHRKEKNTRTPSGEAINSHFEQTSASFIGNWALTDDIESQLLVLSSKGKDIGKANNEDFENKKYTIYPEENHLITQFGLVSSDDWQMRAAIHKQDLATKVTRFNKRINTVDTQATDYSLSFLQRWRGDTLDGQWGVEQEYRDNINAKESEKSLNSDDFSTITVLAASQFNNALFGNVNYPLDDWSFTTGARYSQISQKSEIAGHAKKSDQALTGFASAAYQLNEQWGVTSSVSTGFRFPTVTERFFNGTTARGTTLGNADLAPETARNVEFGFAYSNANHQLQFTVFNNHIKNYIERINIDEDTRTYKNLDQGDIKGLEFSYDHQLTDTFSYTVSGHRLAGNDANGDALGDISPNKLQLALNYRQDDWQANLRIKHRFSHTDVASGETPLEAVNIINGSFTYDLSDAWQLSLWSNNLLNEEYRLTSDNKSAQSAQRQFGLTVSWAMD
jgi:outer membrane receptor protein involved in Fe transport